MRPFVILSVAVVGVVAVSLDVRGNYLDVGNAGYTDGSGTGNVNFAVYENNGSSGNWQTDLGITSLVNDTVLTVDGTESIVVFYQITRGSDGTAGALTSLSVTNDDGIWSGGGWLTLSSGGFGTVFIDPTNGTVQGALDGTGGLVTLGTTAADGARTSISVDATADPTLFNSASNFDAEVSTNPNGSPALSIDSSNAEFKWASPDIEAGGHSSILFLVSDEPTFRFAASGEGSVVIGGAPSSLAGGNGIPVGTPEPGSLLLMSLGLIGGGIGGAWRRRKRKAGEEKAPADG